MQNELNLHSAFGSHYLHTFTFVSLGKICLNCTSSWIIGRAWVWDWHLCFLFETIILYKNLKEIIFNIHKCKFYRPWVRNWTSGLLQIGHESGKRQWRQNLSTWRHRHIFWRCRVSFVKLSYWSKFHINIMTGSGVMTIFVYKRLTRNTEIGNTPFWVLPNIWRLGRARDTKFGKNVSNKLLLNATKCQGYSFYRFWVIKGKQRGKTTPPPTQIRVKKQSFLKYILLFVKLWFHLGFIL